MDDLAYLLEPPQLARIVQQTAELGFDMASEPRTGMLLRTLAASKPGARFLELGTGTGMATAWLLAGMSANSELISVDNDTRVQDVARQALGSDPRLQLLTEDGLTFLAGQEAATFDFVFADAMPGKYEALEQALRLVKRGGFYVIDDMLPQANWPEGHAAKVPILLEQLTRRNDFSIATLAWASGLVIAVKR